MINFNEDNKKWGEFSNEELEYILNDEEFNDEWEKKSPQEKRELEALWKRALKNTERYFESGADGDGVEYIFRLFDEPEDRDFELSPDGRFIYVETLPSPLSPWQFVARRWELKYSLPKKEASFMAYQLWYIAGEMRPSKAMIHWFEGEVSSRGLDAARDYLDYLWKELYVIEHPETEINILTAYEKAVETVIENSPTYRAIPLYEEEDSEENPLDEKIHEWRQKIWRAGVTQIGDIGRRLYSWSKRPDVKEKFSNEQISSLWKTFYRTKERLKPFFEKQQRQKKKKDNDNLEELSLF